MKCYVNKTVIFQLYRDEELEINPKLFVVKAHNQVYIYKHFYEKILFSIVSIVDRRNFAESAPVCGCVHIGFVSTVNQSAADCDEEDCSFDDGFHRSCSVVSRTLSVG
jgi:hypothetical protein